MCYTSKSVSGGQIFADKSNTPDKAEKNGKNSSLKYYYAKMSILRFEHLLFDGGEKLLTDTTTTLFAVVSFLVALSGIVVFFSFVFIPRGRRGFGGFLRLLLGGGSLSSSNFSFGNLGWGRTFLGVGERGGLLLQRRRFEGVERARWGDWGGDSSGRDPRRDRRVGVFVVGGFFLLFSFFFGRRSIFDGGFRGGFFLLLLSRDGVS